ncbi:MAG: phosphatidylserine decarboxylase [Gammaproteobacteria bacterium]
MTVAPEGRAIVGGAFAVALAAAWFAGAASWPFGFAALAAVFTAQFFREPARAVQVADNEIVSPADGRVVFIGRAQSPTGKDAVKVSVFMNVFNVHANRSPAAGRVLQSRRFPGAFFNAALDKSSERNERHMIEIESALGAVACVQIAGLLARRVFCYAKEGDILAGGERYGFIRFGSRADLYLPPHLKPAVALGDSVVGGITRIAAAES